MSINHKDVVHLVQATEALAPYRCNRCHRPMKGTTAYDGACECGGLIEAIPRSAMRGRQGSKGRSSLKPRHPSSRTSFHTDGAISRQTNITERHGQAG